jgi:class 3 adenylate cyclase
VCRLLNNFFESLVDCIHQHGGDVMRFAGDSVIALFPTNSLTRDPEVSSSESDGAAACFRALQCSANILGLNNPSLGAGKRWSEGL